MKEQLDRIEAKLDQNNATLAALLDALDDQQEDEAPGLSLDGDVLLSERDALEPL